MMQRQLHANNGGSEDKSNELKSCQTDVDDGSILISDPAPSTPTARIRFPPARTGRDSGYGTDYSPSPSSNTSTRRFDFNDIVAGRDNAVANASEMLAERLSNVSLNPESDSVDENMFDVRDNVHSTVTDETDEEVFNINANNSACKSLERSEVEEIERLSAPHPDNSGGRDGQAGCTFDCSSPVFVKPLSGKKDLTLDTGVAQRSHNSAVPPISRVQTEQNLSQVEHLTRDRSQSLPNVQTVQEGSSEQEVGRQLRRLSDEFFHFHCNRRRHRTLSVESSQFPLRVHINVYAGTFYTDRRTDHDREDSDEDTADQHHDEL